MAEKRERFSLQDVLALQLHDGARNVECQPLQREDPIAERESPAEIRGDFRRRPAIASLARRPHAHLVDFALHVRVGEAASGDHEVAVETQLVDDVLVAGRELEFRLEPQRAGHRRLRRLDRELHHVLEPRGGHGDVEATRRPFTPLTS